LLREHGHSIGLDPSFTVLDRTDSEDRLNLVRNDLGLAKKAAGFPRKNTCLAIYSQTVNACCPLAHVLKNDFPWCAEWERELKELFRGYAEAKQHDNVFDYDDLLLYWAHMMAEPALAVRPRPGRRVPGYERAASADPAGHEARWPRLNGSRRRRAVNILFSSRHGAEHLGFPEAIHASCACRHARTELPLDDADPGSM
jgi:hypothetical protein